MPPPPPPLPRRFLMLLYDLRPNFSRMDPIQQREFIVNYRARRAQEFAEAPRTKSGRVSKVSLGLTAEERTLMKRLGLRQKDITALRK